MHTKIFVFILLPCLAFCSLTLNYSTPFCLTSGGTFQPNCPSFSFSNIEEVFIGRSFPGICGFEEGDEESCNYDEENLDTQIENLKYEIYSNCHHKQSCSVFLPGVATEFCEQTAYVQIAYYCWTENDIIGTQFQISRQFGGNACFLPSENSVSCSEGTTVNFEEIIAQVYQSDDCSGTPICTVNSTAPSTLVPIIENCMGKQSCSFVETFQGDSHEVLGCNGISLRNAGSVSRSRISAMCEGEFNIVEDRISTNDMCIGVGIMLEPIYLEGRVEGSKCYREYVDCQGEEVQNGLEVCPTNQLFDFTTRSCQDEDSFYCTALPPVNLTATPVSSSEIRITWDMDPDSTADRFTVKTESEDGSRDDPDKIPVDSNARDLVIGSLRANVRYTISIQAHESIYDSIWTETSAYTYPSNPDISVGSVSPSVVTFQAQINSQEVDVIVINQTIPTPDPPRTIEISAPGSSFFVDNLEAGTVYTFNIVYKGTDSGLTSLSEQDIRVVTKPNPVSDLLVENNNRTDLLDLSWVYTGNVDSFLVKLRVLSSKALIFENQNVNWTLRSLEQDGLTPGETYECHVIVRYQGRISVLTEKAGQTIPDRGNIEFLSQSDVSIAASWSYSGIATSFELELFNADNEKIDEAVVNHPNTNHNFVGLQPATGYFVEMRVVSGDLRSNLPRVKTVLGFTDPRIVSNLRARPISNTSIVITWDHEASAERYQIGYNSEINPTFQDLQYEPKINNGSLSYTFENLQPATRHRLRVITEANQQRSGAVETNSATLPNDPLNLQVTDNDGTKLTLTWDHLGHSSYFIVEYRNLDFENEQFSADSEASSLRLENLRIGTDYNFRVWAVFIDFNSSGYASLDYQVPCELKQDKWSDGTHGNWMIFLIVYSLIVTILLIVIVVTVVYCFLKYDWETEGGISTIGSTGRSYYVGDDKPIDNEYSQFQMRQSHVSDGENPSTRKEYPSFSDMVGPEQSTRFDESEDEKTEVVPEEKPRRVSSSSNNKVPGIPTVDYDIEDENSVE